MITSIKYGKTYSDVANYANYCVSPKPEDNDYKHGERVLIVEADNLVLPRFSYDIDADNKQFARSLANQFENHAQAFNKNYTNKMICGSIAFHKDDNVDEKLALEIAKSQVKEVVGDSQTLYVVHGDKEHLHVHFMSNFVLMDGTRYKDSMDFRRFELSNERLEIAHGLTRVQQRKALAHIDTEREVKIKAPKSEAVYLAEKGELTKSEYIKANVKNALDMKLNFPDFVDHLKTKDIHLSPNLARTDLVSGVSFYTSDMTGAIKGSDFGKAFTWKSIKENTNYEQDRDIEKIKQCKHDSVNRQFEREIASDNAGDAAFTNAVSGGHGYKNDSISRSDDINIRSIENSSIENPDRPFSVFEEVERGNGRKHEEANSHGSSTGAGYEQVRHPVRADQRESKQDQTNMDGPILRWNDFDAINGDFGRILDLSDNPAISRRDGSELSKVISNRNKDHQLKTQLEALKDVDYQLRAKEYVLDETKEIKGFDDKTLSYLKYLNAENYNILIQPKNLNIIVLDDIKPDFLDKIKEDRIDRMMVIETSPKNYQVWLKFTKIEDEKTKLEIQKALVERFKADEHCGTNAFPFVRCAGFTNRKEKHCKDGKYPMIWMKENYCKSVSPIIEDNLIEYAQKRIEYDKSNRVQQLRIYNVNRVSKDPEECYKRAVDQYLIDHQNEKIDLSKMEFRATCTLIRAGFDDGQIADTLKKLSETIDRKTNVDYYVNRTIKNAHADVDKTNNENSVKMKEEINKMQNEITKGGINNGLSI